MTHATEKVTVLIPCKDEEANIQTCVESAKLIADEIIVADSGSTDETIKIIHQLQGVRLIRHQWHGYAAFKNWAVNFVSHPWVLFIDADERITPELATEIRVRLANRSSNIDAFTVRFQTFFLGHKLRFSNWNNQSVRLVRRDRCHFNNQSVHESIVVKRGRTGRLQNRLYHYTIQSYDQYFEKYLAYSKLAAADLNKRGERVTPLSLLVRPFLRFAYLYFVRGGFLDGMVGIQVCMLQTFFYSFTKRARLWEMGEIASEKAAAAAESQPDSLTVPNNLSIDRKGCPPSGSVSTVDVNQHETGISNHRRHAA